MKALILAAGFGKRLMPLTKNMPKCMIPINKKPLIEHQIMWLRQNNITEIAVNLHYMPEKIKSYLGDGAQLKVKITYSEESEIMGTAGAVKKLSWFFDEGFLGVYGDIYTNMLIKSLFEFHKGKNALLTICIRKKKGRYSNLIQLKKQRIVKFVEKPVNPVGENIENCGIYLCSRPVLEYIPEGMQDFASDVFPGLVIKEPVYGYTIPRKYYWCEMGRLEKYYKHKKEIESFISA